MTNQENDLHRIAAAGLPRRLVSPKPGGGGSPAKAGVRGRDPRQRNLLTEPSAQHRRTFWRARYLSAIRNLLWPPLRLRVSALNNVPAIKLITPIRVNPAKSGQKVFEPCGFAAPKWNEGGPCHTNDYSHQGKLRLIKAKSFGPAASKWNEDESAVIRPNLKPSARAAVLGHSNVACTEPQLVILEGRAHHGQTPHPQRQRVNRIS